jgi:hypothetical protein
MIEPEEYQMYLESGPPDPLQGKLADLRTDLDEILNRIYFIYTMSPFREEMRTRISSRISSLLVSFLVLAAAAILFDTYQAHFRISALLPVIIVGAIGGFVSVQQRIQSAPTEGDAIRGVLALYDGWFSVYLSPLTGAISATVLYLLFAGGLLKGDLFPLIADAGGPEQALDFQSFLSRIEPKDSGAYAKLLIWGFIAGFAERLVPDTLNRLVGTVEASARAKPPALVEARRDTTARPNANGTQNSQRVNDVAAEGWDQPPR